MKYMPMIIFLLLFIIACNPGSTTDPDDIPPDSLDETQDVFYSPDDFVMGADLSYVNQIMQYDGVYRDDGVEKNPYTIFKEKGTNLVRLRLFHNPVWTKEVYENEAGQMYNDLEDVAEAIQQSRDREMAVNLDFHYSDVWADPGHQDIPAAWIEIEDMEVLSDSVYDYTYRTLQYLDNRGLMPEMVQIGNETNCGMLYSNAPDEFPQLNGCDGHWQNLAEIYNSGIKAVRDVSVDSDIDTEIILHVAQPENVKWFFNNLIGAGVTDFDILGFSYYANWSDVSLDQISAYIADFTESFNRKVMIVEAAYPWTLEQGDSYGNIITDPDRLAPGYPATPEGQKEYMIDLVREIISGGGLGVMYWEPAWITSNLKDLWGQGSAWENNAFFDFEGDALPVFDFMTYPYEL